MVSMFSMFLHLVGAAVVSCHASNEVATPALTGPMGVADYFKQLGLDEAVWDAVLEAALALAVFGAASAVLTAYRRRTQSSRPRKAKLASPHEPPPAAKRIERSRVVAPPAGRPELATRQNSEVTPSARGGVSKASSSEADALASAVRAGKSDRLPQLLEAAIKRSVSIVGHQGTSVTEQEVAATLLHSALRACAANRCFKDAIATYEHVAESIGEGSSGLWSVLLYCVVEAGAFDNCRHVFESLCRKGGPSGHDFVNMVRCYTARQDAEGLRQMLAHLCSAGHFVDNYTWNRALAACGAADLKTVDLHALDLAEALVVSGVCVEGLDAVGYNTLMKYNARAGRFSRCFEIHAEMKAKGIEASEITFGILLDACVAGKELECAKQVFDDLCSSGLRLNVVHCTTFIKSLLGAGRLDEAAAVLREMSSSSGVKPDLITYSTVVKAYADSGDVRSALKILTEMIEDGVRPDEIIFNSALTGCSIFPMKSSHVMLTFETLLGLGMKPTTTTLSILLKGLVHTDAWSTSLEVLKHAHQKLRLEPETRLFVQLAQSCVKARATREAREVFDAMLEAVRRRKERVDPAIVSRLLRSCVLSGDHQVANQLRDAAQLAGIAVEAHVEKMMTTYQTKRSRPPMHHS